MLYCYITYNMTLLYGDYKIMPIHTLYVLLSILMSELIVSVTNRTYILHNIALYFLFTIAILYRHLLCKQKIIKHLFCNNNIWKNAIHAYYSDKIIYNIIRVGHLHIKCDIII